ncbi:MAG: helix-turn-helix transcriptional regulator, partial [Myxococcota bacterium]
NALAAEAAVLILRPPTQADTGLLLVEGGERRWESAYQERFFAQDPFADLPLGEVTALADLISEDALLASDFYRDYMEPSGTFHVLGVNTREEDGLEARLRASRGRARPAFGGDERRLCQRLVPHLRRAVRLHARITRTESERDLFAGAVDQLAMASILLDERGRLLRTNPRADDLLRRRRGLHTLDGELRAEQPAGTRALRRAFERALAHRSAGVAGVVEGVRLPVADGEQALRILVRPVPLGRWSEGHAVAAVALFIGESDETARAPLELFQQLFDLTRAEAALAVELAAGRSLDEAARNLGVARNTARAHLRAIFAKTGVGRQSELVRLLLRSAPLA